MALDLLGLREYVTLNPDVRKLDTLYGLLVESEVIPDELRERCDIDFSLTSRNLQIVLSARTSSDEGFCSTTSERVAEVIDDPQKITTYMPDSFQFATAAVAGPYIPASEVPVSAVGTPYSFLTISLSVLPAITYILCFQC